MRLVLCLGWPSVLALAVALAGIRLGEDSMPPGRRVSTSTFAKYEALSVCVQTVTGERGQADHARTVLESTLTTIDLPGPRPYSLPALADTDCSREPAHYGLNAKARRVAASLDGRGISPSPYHLHVYLMPRTSLQMLRLEPHLGDRRVTVEEYIVEGAEPNVVLTGVTFGLYTSIGELADSAALRRFFTQALLMQSQLGAPPRGRP